MAKATAKPVRALLDRGDFQALLDALKKKGFKVAGPTLKDGAIVCAELESVTDLPAGWTDEQDGGVYRLRKRSDEALFGYNLGPDAWKRLLFPPRVTLWEGKRETLQPIETAKAVTRWAFVGVRACDLNAIAIQDDIMMNGPYANGGYAATRKKAFIVAVNCTKAGGTCFCASMKTGPRAEGAFDLSLTEIVGNGAHRFVVEVGSSKGAEILADVPTKVITDQDLAAADKAIAEAEKHMGRTLNTVGLKEKMAEATEHPRWDEVAERCMSCANCTMVCPTCFCMTVEDYTDLKGLTARRDRRWDSCFTVDFSYIHGGSIRQTVRSRYRQWLTHKMSSWVDQFGRFGCVGCGRCITWCPVGIDVTEEATAIQEQATTKEPHHGDH